jgi:hypothetical protein
LRDRCCVVEFMTTETTNIREYCQAGNPDLWPDLLDTMGGVPSV